MHEGACLMRVFWPSDAVRGVSGVIVGWRNSEYDYFVVDVMQGFEVVMCNYEDYLSVLIHSGTKGRQCNPSWQSF